MATDIGRNDPCHCGSGKKYKKCHLEKDQILDQKKRQEAALNAAKVAEEKEQAKEKTSQPSGPKKEPPIEKKKGWFQKVAGKVDFIKNISSRRNIPQNKGG